MELTLRPSSKPAVEPPSPFQSPAWPQFHASLYPVCLVPNSAEQLPLPASHECLKKLLRFLHVDVFSFPFLVVPSFFLMLIFVPTIRHRNRVLFTSLPFSCWIPPIAEQCVPLPHL